MLNLLVAVVVGVVVGWIVPCPAVVTKLVAKVKALFGK